MEEILEIIQLVSLTPCKNVLITLLPLYQLALMLLKFLLNAINHAPQETMPTIPTINTKLNHLMDSQQSMTSNKTLLLMDPSLLPSLFTKTSLTINQEFTNTSVEMPLEDMPSKSSVMELITGSSLIVGMTLGEIMELSELLLEIQESILNAMPDKFEKLPIFLSY